MVEQFTARELTELGRIHRRFQGVGDIRLRLMGKEAVRWTERWDIAKNVGAALVIGGEGMRLIGRYKGNDRLATIGQSTRNLGLVAAVASWVGAGFSDFYAKDAQIERVFREESRRR